MYVEYCVYGNAVFIEYWVIRFDVYALAHEAHSKYCTERTEKIKKENSDIFFD